MSVTRALWTWVLLAAAVVAGALAAAPAASADSGVLTASDFRFALSRTDDSLLSELDAALPNTTLPSVLDRANRRGTACRAPVSYRVVSFCWRRDDAQTRTWYPQGVTTSADATADGRYGDREVLIASWYDTRWGEEAKGSRITFVDLSDPDAPSYRHALLVEPFRIDGGAPSFRPVRVHAGGLAWYGNLLYVADTWRGLRVFDMDRLWKTAFSDPDTVGRDADGGFQGGGYGLVVPQVGRYLHSTEGGQAGLRFSFVSVDRTADPDALVFGEYSAADAPTRLARIPVDETSRLLRQEAGDYARCTEAYRVAIRGMQGVARIAGRYLVSTSITGTEDGDLVGWSPGEKREIEADVFPPGPEDLSYWAARDELWSLSEFPGQRYVYALRASEL